MTYLFTAIFFTFIGWAVGSGNWKAIWAWIVAALSAAIAFAEPYWDALMGAF